MPDLVWLADVHASGKKFKIGSPRSLTMAKSLKIRSWLVIDPKTDGALAHASGADAVAIDLRGETQEVDEAAIHFQAAWASQEPQRSLTAVLPAFSSGRTDAATGLAVRLGATTLVLSDTRSGAEVQRLDVILRVAELRTGIDVGSISIVPLIDASGLLVASSFQRCSSRLVAIGWRLGCNPHSDTARLAQATTVLAATSAGVRAIDAVSITNDENAFQAESELAHRNGFGGKFCRSPEQVIIANRVFGDQPPAPSGRVISNTSEPPSA